MSLGNRTIRSLNLLVTPIVTLAFSGCATMSDIRELRDLPGFTRSDVSREKTFYDPAVRAYRLMAKDRKQPIMRGPGGKKIQTEEELTRFIAASEKEVIGLGAQGVEVSLQIVYFPVLVPYFIALAVILIPWTPLFFYTEATYKQEAENAYTAGRRHFDAGEAEAALISWERAKFVMPSLRAFSDIEYWRGRAFEALGQTRNARTAYEEFLSYSEQSIPAYFKDTYPADLTWLEKAEDSERRIANLK